MAIVARVDTKKRAKNKLIGILVALGIILFVIIVNLIATQESRKTIAVMKVKADQNISANTLITDNMVEKYDMNYKEYKNYGTQKFTDGKTRGTIIRWEDKDMVLNQKYSSYFLRENTVVFWDSLASKAKKTNSYLYDMSGELININLDTSDFGNMVVPGDTLNIYVTYTDDSYSLSTEQNYVSNGGNSQAGTKTEKLFNEVTVLDMLNSNGDSIFDIYYDYIDKSNKERQELLADENWKSSVEPTSILLEVTSEEALHFKDVSSKSPTYTMTLLPRTQGNSMLDSLSEIQKVLGQ